MRSKCSCWLRGGVGEHFPATYELKRKELHRREFEDDIMILNHNFQLTKLKITLSIRLVKKNSTKVSIVYYKNYGLLRMV